MIRMLAVSAALALSALLVSPARAADEQPKKTDIEASDPRAAVIDKLFTAILANDTAGFKACVTKEAAERLTDDKITKQIAGISQKYKQLFQETKPADLQHSYAGDDKKGAIYLSSKQDRSKSSPKLAVVKEGDAWKVDMH